MEEDTQRKGQFLGNCNQVAKALEDYGTMHGISRCWPLTE